MAAAWTVFHYGIAHLATVWAFLHQLLAAAWAKLPGEVEGKFAVWAFVGAQPSQAYSLRVEDFFLKLENCAAENGNDQKHSYIVEQSFYKRKVFDQVKNDCQKVLQESIPEVDNCDFHYKETGDCQ